MMADRLIPLLLLGALLLGATELHAQTPVTLRTVPQRLSYQAVARDGMGRIVPNQPLVVRISILGGSASGPVQYMETHEVLTNQFGLFAVQVGGGAPQVGTFEGIPWADGNQWVRVELDPNGGTNYLPAGESRLLSVPYALVAEKVNSMSLSDLVDMNLDSLRPGQTIVYDGSKWVNTTIIDTAGNRGVLTTPRISGSGLPGSPLDLAGQGARPGQVLKWNGTAWVPGDDSVGLGGSLTYVAGNGIRIVGNTIAHSIWQDNGGTSTTYGGRVGIGTTSPNPSALLDLYSTQGGILIPRMTTQQRDGIAQPATSLLIFNTSTNRFEYNAGTPTAPNWLPLGGGSGGPTTINNLGGAGPGSNAGSVQIPHRADSMTIAATSIQAGAAVTITLFDPDNTGVIPHVSSKTAATGFSVRFSSPFPNPNGRARIDYIIVNP